MNHNGTIAEETAKSFGGRNVEIQEPTFKVSASWNGVDTTKTYAVWKGLVVILPCLPARSPTWQVSGWVASQGGFSPRW